MFLKLKKWKNADIHSFELSSFFCVLLCCFIILPVFWRRLHTELLTLTSVLKLDQILSFVFSLTAGTANSRVLLCRRLVWTEDLEDFTLPGVLSCVSGASGVERKLFVEPQTSSVFLTEAAQSTLNRAGGRLYSSTCDSLKKVFKTLPNKIFCWRPQSLRRCAFKSGGTLCLSRHYSAD